MGLKSYFVICYCMALGQVQGTLILFKVLKVLSWPWLAIFSPSIITIFALILGFVGELLALVIKFHMKQKEIKLEK